MAVNTTILTQQRSFSPTVGLADQLEEVVILPDSTNRFGATGATVNVPLLTNREWFDLLPVATTVTAVSSKNYLLIGSNTPLATQSTKGGLKLVTGGTNTNQAGVAGIANTGTYAPITATNGIVFRTMVNVPSLVTVGYYSAGLNQNLTDVNPMATAGEGAAFLADPTNGLTATTLATAAQALNWILCYKVNGTYTYGFTTIPILAGADTRLTIQLNPDLTASMYVNGVLAGTSPALATANATLSPVVGCRTLATATATMDTRFIEMGRLIG